MVPLAAVVKVIAGAILVDTMYSVDTRSLVWVIVLAGAMLTKVLVILSVDAG